MNNVKPLMKSRRKWTVWYKRCHCLIEDEPVSAYVYYPGKSLARRFPRVGDDVYVHFNFAPCTGEVFCAGVSVNIILA